MTTIAYSPTAVRPIKRYFLPYCIQLCCSWIAKSLELLGEGEESTATNDEYVKQSTPAPLTTIAVPPATRTQELTLQSSNKRTKDRDYQRKRRANASLRSTGTADSDEELVSAASASSRRPTKRSRMADDSEP